MKSFRIANAAIAATGVTLAAVAMLGSPERLLGSSYDRAITASASQPGEAALAVAAHAPGSEHFWLTRPATAGQGQVALRLTEGSGLALDAIRQAVATAGAVAPDALDIVGIQELPRLDGDGNAAGTTLLVTARIGATSRQPARMVRFVIDGAAPVAGRAL